MPVSVQNYSCPAETQTYDRFIEGSVVFLYSLSRQHYVRELALGLSETPMI